MITIKNLNKIHNQGRANEFQSLRNINLRIEEGQLAVLNGVSGSGKTTLLTIIAALIKPTSGEVIVDGRRVAKLPDLHISAFRTATMGFVFQAFNLFDELSVQNNAALPLVPTGIKQSDIDAKVETALGLANIKHKAAQKVADLSGGEKQRCAIARALVAEPKIILCDEPTANLDRDNSLKFLAIMEKLKAHGKTIIIATHDPIFDDRELVDVVVKMKDGRISPS